MIIDRVGYIQSLSNQLKKNPAVVILGARQIGKTTLAKQYAKQTGSPYLYLDLENPEDINKLGDDPVSFLDFHKDKLVIIDEVQTIPKIYNSLRPIIDKDKRNGRFILLGSASPLLIKGVSESLAGRISYLDLSPFKLEEINPPFDMNHHWLKGGFPIPFLAEDIQDSHDWISNFVRSYVERDLNILFDRNFNPVLSRRLWAMLANLHGSTLNLNNLARSLGVTAPVVNTYIDYLEGAFVIQRLLPWHINTNKRLVKSPKIYIRDSGILHFFHRIKSRESLIENPIVGASWEGYVIEQILYHKPSGLGLYFYRTHNGAEIDLLLVDGIKPVTAIEIKLSNSPKVSRGFHSACDDLGVERKVVITPEADGYPLSHGTEVTNLRAFLDEFN